MSVVFFEGVTLALRHHTPPCPAPIPTSSGHRTLCAPASLLWLVAAHVHSSLPLSALAKCWLRGLYTHPTHTHAHRTRLFALPASTRRPGGASRLRHVVWMVAPTSAASLAREGICTIGGSLALLLCCVPLHRDFWDHTHAATTAPALWRLRLWRGVAPWPCAFEWPAARPALLPWWATRAIRRSAGGDVPPLVFHSHTTQRTLHPTQPQQFHHIQQQRHAQPQQPGLALAPLGGLETPPF